MDDMRRAMPSVVIGTDAVEYADRRRRLHRLRLFQVVPDKTMAGIRHAVPAGKSRALCDVEPMFLWPQEWPGEIRDDRDVCSICRLAAAQA